MGELHKFEGRQTVGCKAKITNAGDGLSAALEIEPDELHLGQKVWLVIEGTVSKITHEEAKEGRGVIRVQSIKAGVATLVDETLVKDVLDEQRIAIEEAAGVTRLDFDTEVG